MAVADLRLGSIVLPRSESPLAISRLAEFKWFQKIDVEGDRVTPEIDDLLLEAQKIYQDVDGVVKKLGVPQRVGIIEILFKGTVIKRRSYELDEIQGMIDDLRKDAPDIIARPAELLGEAATLARSIEEYSAIRGTLQVAKKLDVDLAGFSEMRHFYINLFVIESADYAEIERAAPDVTLYKYELDGKQKSAVLLICGAHDSEKMLRIFRSFNSNPFVLPQGIPQVPSKAFAMVESKIKELETRQKSVQKELAGIKKGIRADVMALHEKAQVAKEVLETLRKPGGTRNFAVIQGYIPASMEEKFKEIASRWTPIVEKLSKEHLKNAPTLFENKRFVRTFEIITESQGLPKRGERDPTPMIALMWPIFYGLMFADVGHGLLLMGMGLLFKIKGQGGLSRWGMLIAISGAAAAIAGVGAGEAFGFHIDYFDPFSSLLKEGGALYQLSWIVGIISVAELTFDQVINILKVSLFIGIVHLVWAMLLRIRKMAAEGHKLAIGLEAIPNITLYGGIVVIMMCAIGAQYDVSNMYSRTHTEAVPWVTIFLGEWAEVWIITRISAVIVIASMGAMMVGGILHARRHPEEGGSPANVIMEVLLGKTVESLAHTISYARIGIMLLVHAALLLTVNNAFKSLGGVESPAAWAMIIGGNLGIMMIEGLIVYIQSLRLHLYEFFTKWYDGGGGPFKQVGPELVYNQLKWRH